MGKETHDFGYRCGRLDRPSRALRAARRSGARSGLRPTLHLCRVRRPHHARRLVARRRFRGRARRPGGGSQHERHRRLRAAVRLPAAGRRLPAAQLATGGAGAGIHLQGFGAGGADPWRGVRRRRTSDGTAQRRAPHRRHGQRQAQRLRGGARGGQRHARSAGAGFGRHLDDHVHLGHDGPPERSRDHLPDVRVQRHPVRHDGRADGAKPEPGVPADLPHRRPERLRQPDLPYRRLQRGDAQLRARSLPSAAERPRARAHACAGRADQLPDAGAGAGLRRRRPLAHRFPRHRRRGGTAGADRGIRPQGHQAAAVLGHDRDRAARPAAVGRDGARQGGFIRPAAALCPAEDLRSRRQSGERRARPAS